MNNFSDISPGLPASAMIGKRISIKEFYGQEIIVHRIRFSPTKYDRTSSEECLTLQCTTPTSDDFFIIFTGSVAIQEQVRNLKPDQYPFKAKVNYENKSLYLS